jgi:hypothetical protein
LGVLGYVPTAAGQGEVVGLIDLHLGNIMGTARRRGVPLRAASIGIARSLVPLSRAVDLRVVRRASRSAPRKLLRDTLYSRTDLDLG